MLTRSQMCQVQHFSHSLSRLQVKAFSQNTVALYSHCTPTGDHCTPLKEHFSTLSLEDPISYLPWWYTVSAKEERCFFLCQTRLCTLGTLTFSNFFSILFLMESTISLRLEPDQTRVLHRTCTFRCISPPKWMMVEVEPAPESAFSFLKEICTSPAWHPTLTAPTDPAMVCLHNREFNIGAKTCAVANNYSSGCAKK